MDHALLRRPGDRASHGLLGGVLVGLALPLAGKHTVVLTVNGAARQDSDLANMMWGVAEVIHQLSLQAELRAGDLIYSGTPDGVAPLKPGDVMVARIDGLSELRVTVA